MSQLQSLNLSHLPIQLLPHEFFSNLTNFRSLVLTGCSNLRSLPNFPQVLTALRRLDLSYLPIETLPETLFFDHLKKLRWVILRGCSKLGHLPSIRALEELELLDLSHCTALQELTSLCSYNHPRLRMLHLSSTCLHSRLDIGSFFSLTHLFLRNAKGGEFDSLAFPSGLEVLDLSGAQSVRRIDQLRNNRCLVALDLSETGIESVDFISDLISLRSLLLKGCTRLVQLPRMKSLTNLEVLDISGCEILHLDPLNPAHRARVETNSIEGHIHPKCDKGISISKPNELHLVSTFTSCSGFDRFKQRFEELVHSSFQTSRGISKPLLPLTGAVLMLSGSLQDDLRYILVNVGRLESSSHCRNSEELLSELVHAADRHQADDFPLYDSTHLNQLLRVVVKLKLLVPAPKQVNDLKKKKKKPDCENSKNEEEVVDTDVLKMISLRSSYESLTEIQRNCLLYFAVFPCSHLSQIKDRTLIYLWYGEGFIDPIGQQILKVLDDEGFVGRLMETHQELRNCRMEPDVHSFVMELARAEGFFDLHTRNGNIKRALLSSCKQLECFKSVRTLLNVDVPLVDIEAEWFSKMRNLPVLHLGSWDSKEIDVVSFKFLEELENMKQSSSFQQILSLSSPTSEHSTLEIAVTWRSYQPALDP